MAIPINSLQLERTVTDTLRQSEKNRCAASFIISCRKESHRPQPSRPFVDGTFPCGVKRRTDDAVIWYSDLSEKHLGRCSQYSQTVGLIFLPQGGWRRELWPDKAHGQASSFNGAEPGGTKPCRIRNFLRPEKTKITGRPRLACFTQLLRLDHN